MVPRIGWGGEGACELSRRHHGVASCPSLVIAHRNDLVGSLKRVQENRHKVQGDIPLELLECVTAWHICMCVCVCYQIKASKRELCFLIPFENPYTYIYTRDSRMDREDLSPHVFTIESLERAVTEVRALAQRDAMLQELRRGVEEGLAGGGGEEGGGEGVVGMDVGACDAGGEQGLGRS